MKGKNTYKKSRELSQNDTSYELSAKVSFPKQIAHSDLSISSVLCLNN